MASNYNDYGFDLEEIEDCVYSLRDDLERVEEEKDELGRILDNMQDIWQGGSASVAYEEFKELLGLITESIQDIDGLVARYNRNISTYRERGY